MLLRLTFSLFAASLLSLRLTALEPTDVSVRIAARGEDGAFKWNATITPGENGTRFLSVHLTNNSTRDVFLEQVTVEFPWLAPLADADQLATGGGCMFNSPTLVHAAPATEAFSTAFLLGRYPNRCDFAGFVTWKIFRSELSLVGDRVRVVADGEGRRVSAGETVALEKIWLARGAHWQDLLFSYADRIVAENRIRLKPRPTYVGWSNWDYYGSRFTPAQILENLDELMALGISPNLLQIDGGWANRSGDYLHPGTNFPQGMKPLADAIRARGLQAGIHLDGMRADHDSQVVTRHPEFFLKDQNGDILGLAAAASGKRTRVYFDFSHPGAREHMRQAIASLREQGFDYFKFDFLKFAFPKFIYQDTPGISRETTRIVPFDDRYTSVERSHLAMATFREAMGDDAYLLACTAEFGPTAGYADGQRTGGDIDPTYSRFSRSCMENGGNFYLHQKVFLNDADYLVVRGREDEDAELVNNPRKTGGDMPFALAEMWAHYVGLFGGPKLLGDKLSRLRPERKELARRTIALPACDRYVPIDFWQHARDRDDPFTIFLGEAEGRVYLVLFNWSPEARRFQLSGFGRASEAELKILSGSAPFKRNGDALEAELAPHSSVVFALGDSAKFDLLRRTLAVK